MLKYIKQEIQHLIDFDKTKMDQNAPLAFFGALFSALGSLAGAFGGGAPDNTASIQASVQNQKLQSATERANQAAVIAQRERENQLNVSQNAGDAQQQALGNIVSGFRSAFLRNLLR